VARVGSDVSCSYQGMYLLAYLSSCQLEGDEGCGCSRHFCGTEEVRTQRKEMLEECAVIGDDSHSFHPSPNKYKYQYHTRSFFLQI
jgi:hypothetical protein